MSQKAPFSAFRVSSPRGTIVESWSPDQLVQIEASERKPRLDMDHCNWQRLSSSVHLRNADRGSCYYATLLIYHQVDVYHSIVDLGTSFEGIKVRAQETNHDSCVWVNHLRNSQNGWERERDIIGCCFEVSVESSIVRDLVQQHAGVLYQQLA